MELASCHPSGNCNIGAAPRFSDNLCTPTVDPEHGRRKFLRKVVDFTNRHGVKPRRQHHQQRCVNMKYSNWKQYGCQGVVKFLQYPLLPEPHPHLPVAHPALTNGAMQTESQRYNCPIIRWGRAAEHACQATRRDNPTSGLPSGRLATRHWEFSITFKPQYKDNKSKWLLHITRMDNNMMPKIMLNCRPNGRRRLGRPLKRLLDEAETGLSRPNWWRLMMMMMMETIWKWLWYDSIIFCLRGLLGLLWMTMKQHSRLMQPRFEPRTSRIQVVPLQ